MASNALITYLQNQVTQITLNLEHIQKDISLLNTQFDQKIFNIKRDFSNKDEQIQLSIEQLRQHCDHNIISLENKILNLDEHKMDQQETYQMMESNRSNIQEDLELLKNEIKYQNKYFDDQLTEKLRKLDISTLTESVYQFKDQLKAHYQDTQKSLNEHQTLTKSLLTANKKAFFQELEHIVQQLNTFKIEFNDQNQQFIKKPELETKINAINLYLEQKSDLIEVQNALNTQQIDVSQRFQEFKDEVRTVLELQGNEFYQLINKKANHSEIVQQLQTKVDKETLILHTEDKLPVKDFHKHMSLIENIAIDLGKKADAIAVNEFKEATQLQMTELQKDIQRKQSKRDFKEILDKKANHEDVSKAFNEIQQILQNKFSFDDFNRFQMNQNTLNEQLCSQNILGRWLFKGSFLSPGSLVPWNVQSINTLSENFLWDKDKPNIVVVAAGIYEITLGFYAKKKPKIDIMVNGEVIINAVNNSSYVIHHSSGKLKDTKTSVTGLTMIDFISLPSRARVNIAYQGDLGEGFLSLRKV